MRFELPHTALYCRLAVEENRQGVDGLKVWMDVGESSLNLGNKGIVLHVGSGTGKVGRLRIGRAVVEYFPGRTSVNSKTVSLEALLKFIKENGT